LKLFLFSWMRAQADRAKPKAQASKAALKTKKSPVAIEPPGLY
jgi:hypothetical protein